MTSGFAPRPDVTWHAGVLSRAERWAALHSVGATVWFTGLSGAGKSTLASAVEHRLVTSGRAAYRLDGDNLRSGLNADLGFNRTAREENIRRVAEVAWLFADSGTIALVALISPYAEARRRARALHEDAGVRFVEVYVATPISVCAERDPKGLYARATSGTVASFTGVDDPYEAPLQPDIVVESGEPLDGAVDRIISVLD
jgi:adenylyl-sulfate kinase